MDEAKAQEEEKEANPQEEAKAGKMRWQMRPKHK